MSPWCVEVLGLVCALLQGREAVAQGGDERLELSAVRFYLAEANLTQVKAFVQVPLALLRPSPSGVLAFRVTVQLKDSVGLKLDEAAWPIQHISARLQEPGAFTVSSMEFLIRPGRYQLEVVVMDSVRGADLTDRAEVVGYSTRPPASDLVLAPRMRPFNADSSVGETEWRSGQILITSIAHVRLNPAIPTGNRVFYLLEAYTASPDSGSMQVWIKDSTGRTMVQTTPQPVQLGAGGGVLRGQLNLEGLPSGEYQFSVAVQLTAGTTERSAHFTVLDLQSQLQRQADLAEAKRLTDEGYFAGMDEPQLDAAQEPLEYLASARDLRAYRGASIEAKRRFLTAFWRQRDPDTSDLRNPVREAFYGAIAYADSNFRERGARTQPGWKTDRGRIYARLGGPDEKLDKPREGRAPPYLVWRYTRTRNTWFIFADRSGLGNYKLMASNDRNEPEFPGWGDLLGPDAVRDIGLYLGVDFFSRNR
jgi:GWxTD domain-containing protein